MTRLLHHSKQKVLASRLGQGRFGAKVLGHRDYVGGLWDEIGRLQFDFLLDKGLQPSDTVVDIACGSLRAGVHLIPYLEPGHYLGIDKQATLLKAGLKEELSRDVRVAKRPELVASASFEFEKFSRRPTFGIAQSLFTHLHEPVIRECLRKARGFFLPGGRLFATYFEGDPDRSPSRAHDHRNCYFTREQMVAFGEQTGWQVHYIGDWGHPRGQVMVEYLADS